MLEDIAVKRYLMWKPNLEEDLFDSEGNILEKVKQLPAYKGLVDALFERGNQVRTFPESQWFNYAVGYSEGREFSQNARDHHQSIDWWLARFARVTR